MAKIPDEASNRFASDLILHPGYEIFAPRWKALLRRFEAAVGPALGHRRRGQRIDEGAGVRGFFAAQRNGAGIDGPKLGVAWKQSGEFGARHDLADDGDGDF